MFDFVAWHESAARASIDAGGVAIPAGEQLYAYSGDNLQVKGQGYIIAAVARTAAIANLVDWRVGSQDDNRDKWSRSVFHKWDQTGSPQHPAIINYQFKKGAILNADANNGNNAQIEHIAAILSPNKIKLGFGSPDGLNLPAGLTWVPYTGVTAAVANTWSPDAATTTYLYNRDKNYDIHGILGWSTTGYGFRIIPKSGDTSKRPGWELGDTDLLSQALFSESPMHTFKGDQPPSFEKLCSGTDSTATRYAILIREY